MKKSEVAAARLLVKLAEHDGIILADHIIAASKIPLDSPLLEGNQSSDTNK
jgi:hypothetical protein